MPRAADDFDIIRERLAELERSQDESDHSASEESSDRFGVELDRVNRYLVLCRCELRQGHYLNGVRAMSYLRSISRIIGRIETALMSSPVE